jgi:hypothetical protein
MAKGSLKRQKAGALWGIWFLAASQKKGRVAGQVWKKNINIKFILTIPSPYGQIRP